jgi:hypothetical protein
MIVSQLSIGFMTNRFYDESKWQMKKPNFLGLGFWQILEPYLQVLERIT